MRKIPCDSMSDAMRKVREGIPFKHYYLFVERDVWSKDQAARVGKVFIMESNPPIPHPVQLDFFTDRNWLYEAYNHG